MNPTTTTLTLHDIHLPAEISWWPPAPGWWIIFGLFLLLLVIIYILYRRKQARKVYRAAKQELQNIKHDYEQSRDAQQLLQQLSIFLRRACLSFYPRVDVAGLTGTAWLEFLDGVFANSKDTHRFRSETGRLLISAPYQHEQSIDADALVLLCESWCRALPTRKRATP